MTMFQDRTDAGRQLAAALKKYEKDDVVVLALPRGGLPVALEVARALKAPLDLVMVRKVGVPYQPELAMGAVADGPHPERVINHDVLSMAGISEDEFDREAERELAEIDRRRRAYLGDSERVDVSGKTAIIIDDGIATGATVRAALGSVRNAGAARAIVAVPVAPPDAVAFLKSHADEVVCLDQPPFFGAISRFYGDFSQLSDDDVIRIMEEAKAIAGKA